jgi:hypothetical protein
MMNFEPILRRSIHRTFAALFAAAIVFASNAEMKAGGGPENVFLVVNQRSWASLTVANHYIRLRQIPPSNVLYLDWAGSSETSDILSFREQILRPVLAAIQRRQLGDHIDYVIYSSDFPYTIDAGRELGGLKLPNLFTPTGSITGMTYFWSSVMSHRPDFLKLDANRYVRPVERTAADREHPNTHGFHSWYGWGTDGALLEAGGEHYLLSTMLAVTSGRGNSVSEVIAYLERSVVADGSRLPGTIYYMQNSDVRSTTRADDVPAAIESLKDLGVRAVSLAGDVPRNKIDVQGAMLGSEGFSWKDSGSNILSGAICENLTSFGGALHYGAPQTPLTDFLRYGAAGSSGTVVEPYAIQAKFPLPQIQVHYARGCSLAEAFYQSVACPYQLLIVGDPLCRPWATIPQVALSGIAPNVKVQGSIQVAPAVRSASESPVDRLDWYLDGMRLAMSEPDDTITLETKRLADGAHELRAVGVENSPIESQGNLVVPFTAENRQHWIELSSEPPGRARWGEPLKLSVDAPGALGSVVTQGTRTLGKILGPSGALSIDPQVLGSGPVELRAVAIGAQGMLSNVASSPLALNVEPGSALPGRELSPGDVLRPGFELEVEGQPPAIIERMAGESWLVQRGVKAGQSFKLQGVYTVVEDAVYQLQVRHFGSLVMEFDDTVVYDVRDDRGEQHYIPVVLGTGHHRLKVHGSMGSVVVLDLRIGNRGLPQIGGETLQHPVPSDTVQ